MAFPVKDIAYARFRAPDLEQMQRFLEDFGLAQAGRTDERLWMRGAGTEPFAHVTELGEPGYVGFGLRLNSVEDVRILAAAEGVPVEDSDFPGGGVVARLRDPDGFAVDVIADGVLREIDPAVKPQLWNVLDQPARLGTLKRVGTRPATVVRLGHIVHTVADLQRNWEWYAARFSLKISDEVQTDTGNPIALFIRLDRGQQPSDHHTLNFGQFPGRPASFNHAAFEVVDLDDLMAGNKFLQERAYKHRWGVGRHILGSQVFDYWCDPWGHVVEHWTDGDLLTAEIPTGIADLDTAIGVQWGQKAPADLI